MQVSKVIESVVSVPLETSAALRAIRRVNTEAFGRLAEANLVDVLRRHGQVITSLVAEVDKEVVGHLVLTEVTLLPVVPGLRLVGLGPVAVAPEFQSQGIGSRLIRQAVRHASEEGWHAMVVLGDPQYYKRFGFIPASHRGLECEFQVPAETFSVLELQAGVLDGLHGVVRYKPEFSGF